MYRVYILMRDGRRVGYLQSFDVVDEAELVYVHMIANTQQQFSVPLYYPITAYVTEVINDEPATVER